MPDRETRSGGDKTSSWLIPSRWAAVRKSVFAKLVAIMVAMGACLVLLVTALFWLLVGPRVNPAIHRMTQAVTGHPVAHSSPESGASEAIASEASDVHGSILLVVLLTTGGLVFGAHVMLKRLLQPLRTLSDGVTRLSAGQLDVVLPTRTRDEFGTLTDAFNQMVGRVRAMIGARDQLLLDVSHELRSPITRMKVALEFLPEDGRRTRLAEDLAEMERMVTELIELERLRQADGITRTRQDVIGLLHEVVADFHARPPGVRIVSAPAELHADIDGAAVRAVLRNLLDNAAKYSSPASGPVEIAASRDADGLVIRITDEGIGIPDGDVERVFEPFFRVDRSRSRGTGGYGLGLSICKRVMEAHDGSISVERRPGPGSSFVLKFPMAGVG